MQMQKLTEIVIKTKGDKINKAAFIMYTTGRADDFEGGSQFFWKGTRGDVKIFHNRKGGGMPIFFFNLVYNEKATVIVFFFFNLLMFFRCYT